MMRGVYPHDGIACMTLRSGLNSWTDMPNHFRTTCRPSVWWENRTPDVTRKRGYSPLTPTNSALPHVVPQPALTLAGAWRVFGPRLDPHMTGSCWIIGSQRVHRIPTVPAASNGLGPSLLYATFYSTHFDSK